MESKRIDGRNEEIKKKQRVILTREGREFGSRKDQSFGAQQTHPWINYYLYKHAIA